MWPAGAQHVFAADGTRREEEIRHETATMFA